LWPGFEEQEAKETIENTMEMTVVHTCLIGKKSITKRKAKIKNYISGKRLKCN